MTNQMNSSTAAKVQYGTHEDYDYSTPSKDFHRYVVLVNGYNTNLMVWDEYATDDNVSSIVHDNMKDLIIFVPGNPGIGTFYKDFIQMLYDHLRVPIWCLSYLGHENEAIPLTHDNKVIFTLNGQVIHFYSFIMATLVTPKTEMIFKNINLFFIGHSTGAKIIMELMRRYNVLHQHMRYCFFLHPAIEHISHTPNGNIFYKRVAYWTRVSRFVSYLPEKARKYVASVYCHTFSINKDFIQAALFALNENVLSKILFLGQDLMNHVQDLDVATIEKIKNTSVFYYGQSDNWVPEEYFVNLCNRVNGVHVKVCGPSIGHNFVLSYRCCQSMADTIANDIKVILDLPNQLMSSTPLTKYR